MKSHNINDWCEVVVGFFPSSRCGNKWKHKMDLTYLHNKDVKREGRVCTTHKRQIEKGRAESLFVSDEDFKRICPDCDRRYGQQTIPFALKAWKPWSYKNDSDSGRVDQPDADVVPAGNGQ